MEFLLGVVKVIVGGFALFTVARVAYGSLVPRAGWAWVGLVAVLALCNMVLHRWWGSSINPPFFTAILFGVALSGLAPNKTVAESTASYDSRWLRRGRIALIVGTILGWLSYGEVGGM